MELDQGLIWLFIMKIKRYSNELAIVLANCSIEKNEQWRQMAYCCYEGASLPLCCAPAGDLAARRRGAEPSSPIGALIGDLTRRAGEDGLAFTSGWPGSWISKFLEFGDRILFECGERILFE